MAATGTSNAQENDATYDQPRDFFSLGVASSINDLEFSGGRLNANVFPFLSFRAGRFYSEQAGIGFELVSRSSFRAALVAEVGVDGLNRNNVDALADMENLDLPIYTGLLLEAPVGKFNITSKIQREIGLASGGWRLTGAISRPLRVTNKLSMSPSLGFEWQDSKSTNYLYGVPVENVTSLRAAYRASDSLKVNAGVSGVYRLNNKWTLIANMGATWYDGSIYNSPIVDERVTFGSFIALGYNF